MEWSIQMAKRNRVAILGWIILGLILISIFTAGAGHFFADEMCMTGCQDALVATPNNPRIINNLLDDFFYGT